MQELVDPKDEEEQAAEIQIVLSCQSAHSNGVRKKKRHSSTQGWQKELAETGQAGQKELAGSMGSTQTEQDTPGRNGPSKRTGNISKDSFSLDLYAPKVRAVRLASHGFSKWVSFLGNPSWSPFKTHPNKWVPSTSRPLDAFLPCLTDTKRREARLAGPKVWRPSSH